MPVRTLKTGMLRPSVGLVCLALAALVLAPNAGHGADRYAEDAVKAAFLFRFPGYVDWPREALDDAAFTIAVLEADAVALELGRLLPQHPIKNLPAQVRSIRGLDDLGDAQILYVGPRYAGELAPLVAALGTRPVLLVTDHAQGLDAGSAVNFLLVDRRVRFEISMPGLAQAGLRVQPALLSVAARVRNAAPAAASAMGRP